MVLSLKGSILSNNPILQQKINQSNRKFYWADLKGKSKGVRDWVG